jgi:acyl-CoA reductase-like NAD-dependent aldehyde dehydrogenase
MNELDGRCLQYIGGDWVPASNGQTWDVINPASEEVVCTVPYGTGADVVRAIDAAAAAFPIWASKTPHERATVLKGAADRIRASSDTLAKTTVLESGKPVAQARAEWLVVADLFEWFAEEGKRAYGRIIPSRMASRRHYVLKQPVGVVGIITAWNFPAYNPGRAGAAALAAGCTVVFRPSEFTPLTGMALVDVLVQAGAPAGVVNIVSGEPEAMGQAMLDHPACAKIQFTGSVRVGKHLMDGASRTVTRLSLELGGNAPVLIFPDVDVAAVAAGAVTAKFRNNGQVCISPQRFLVHRTMVDEFQAQVVPKMQSLKVGDGLDPATQVGPLINARQRERVESLVESAKAQGAELVMGGSRPANRSRGFFFEPTLVVDHQAKTALFEEEVFGPVLPVASFNDIDEAVAIANSTRYGLASYVWTNDLRTATHASERLHFGMVGVNEWTPQAVEGPFVGWKESGLGRESGAEGLEEFLETKLVTFGAL